MKCYMLRLKEPYRWDTRAEYSAGDANAVISVMAVSEQQARDLASEFTRGFPERWEKNSNASCKVIDKPGVVGVF